MANLGSIFISIRAKQDKLALDLSKARNKVEEAAIKMDHKLQSIDFKKVALAATAATGAMVFGITKAIGAASDLEETTSKFETVFKGQEALANSFTQELVNGYATSTEEARRFLSSIQDLLVPMGMNAASAAKMSGEVVKLSADLGSFNNLETEQVMLDIQSALVGNFETMKKYGVVLNATNVGQKALTLGLADTKDALTAADKAQAAYVLITEGSAAAIGDMARTSESFANQQKQLNATWKDFSANIGKLFLPIATSTLKLLNGFVLSLKENEQAFKNMYKNGVLVVLSGLKAFLQIGKAVEKVFHSIRLVGQLAFQGLALVVTDLLKVVAKMFKPFEALAKLLVKMGKIENNPFETFRDSIDQFRESNNNVTSSILDDLSNVDEKYKVIEDSIDNTAMSTVGLGDDTKAVTDSMVKDIGGVTTATSETKEEFVSLKDQMAEAMIQAKELSEIDDLWANFGAEAAKAKGPVLDLFDQFTIGFVKAIDSQTTWATTAIDLGKTTSKGMHDAISSNLFDVLTGDFDNLGEAWEGLMSSMLSSFTDNIADMVLQGGKLGNIIALAGAAGTVIQSFQSSEGAGGASALGAGVGFAFGGPIGSLVGAQIGNLASDLLGLGINKLPSFSGEFNLDDRFSKAEDVNSLLSTFGRDFSAIFDIGNEIADSISENLLDSASTLPEQYRDAFRNILSEQPLNVPFELDANDLEGSFEIFSNDLGLAAEGAFSNSLEILAKNLGFVSAEAFTDYLEMVERTSQASGVTIGNAFRVGLESSSFGDFGDTIRQQVFDSVFEGMITALTQSEIYRQALQPIFAGIEDAFTISMGEGTFDAGAFNTAIQPVLEGLNPAIDALKPAFDAVDNVLSQVQESIFGPQADALVNVDNGLATLTTVSETGTQDIVAAINDLNSTTQTLADTPVNVTVNNGISGIDTLVEDIIVEREESGLTNGERTVSL